MAVAGQYLAAVMASGGRPPQQAVLLAVLQDNYQMNADAAGDPYAVAYAVPGVAIQLKGRGSLRQRLAADMWELTGQQPSQEALSTVLGTAEGWAAGARRVQPSIRLARTGDGRIALDLGRSDGAAVLLRPGSWEISTAGLARFRRSAAVAELPVPVSGGRFPSLVNIAGKDELALYAGCRVMSLMPGGTRPVELMLGQPGAAKTATTRMTVRWLGGAMPAMPRDPRDWVAMAAGSHCLGHDNVSGMSAARQDLLCMAASGHEHLARMLYSDADLYAVRFQPLTIVINGIEVGMLRSDFIRRAVIHELGKPDAYLPDSAVERAWDREWPGALGWLCDVTVQVMALMEKMRRPEGDSLADFAWVLAGIDALWGTKALELWRAGQGRLYAGLAEDDQVAMAVVRSIAGSWTGTAGDLLELLRRGGMMSANGHGPWTPRKLAGALARAQGALEALGWTVIREQDPHGKQYKYTIRSSS